MPLWRGGPNIRTLPTVLLTPPASKAADMAHLCVPQNQALRVCRGFVPDIQVCSTHGREDLVNATITSNAKEEEEEEEKEELDFGVCSEETTLDLVYCDRFLLTIAVTTQFLLLLGPKT